MIKSKQEFKNAGVFYQDDTFFSIWFVSEKKMGLYTSNFTKIAEWSVKLNPNGGLVRTYDNKFIMFDDGISMFFEDGKLDHTELRFYLKFENNLKVYIDIHEEHKLYIENSDQKYWIDFFVGKKIFLEKILIQEVANKNLMIATSLLDGYELWRLDYNKIIDAENVYGGAFVNFGNKIYLILSSSVKRGLFCIDAKTGEVIDFFPDILSFAINDANNIYANKFRGIICKINAITHEIHEWDVHKLITDSGFYTIGDSHCTVADGILYFTQNMGAKNAKLGILDTNSQQLLCKYDFPPECGTISSIQVSKERLFVHTQDKTLHIFEKE